MDGLADIAVQYFGTILFAGSDCIDPDFSSKEFQSFPEFTAALTDAERTALSSAAQRSLDLMTEATSGSGIRTFLKLLASGEIYEQWCAER